MRKGGEPVVLVVEDDSDVRETVGIALADEGYAVALVCDGQEALEWLRTHPTPRLILLDWMMPRCNGEQFRAQQAGEPAFAAIPTVVMTADVRARDAPAARSAAALVLKPVDLDVLLTVVHRYGS